MEKADSDSAKSPRGDEEKRVGEHTENGGNGLSAMPDPDAGLSNEERARIVRELWILMNTRLHRLIL